MICKESINLEGINLPGKIDGLRLVGTNLLHLSDNQACHLMGDGTPSTWPPCRAYCFVSWMVNGCDSIRVHQSGGLRPGQSLKRMAVNGG